jgi:hypothetical protein
MTYIRQSITIDGYTPQEVIWTPQNPDRGWRKDTIEVAGKEFEQQRFKGRKLFKFGLKFRGYDDSMLVEMETIRDLLAPAISDVGTRTQAPKVHSIIYAPLAKIQISNFTPDQDSGAIFWSDQERAWVYDVTMTQYSNLLPMDRTPLHADEHLGSFGSATPVIPSTPSVANPSAVNGAIGGAK